MDIVDENVEARNDNIDNPNRDNANDDNFEAPDDNEIVNLGPEIEEAIINNEDNEVIRDPNFTIGEEIASFENDNLKLSFRRVHFKKYERFNLTDYNFSLKIDFKKNYQDVLMTTVLDGYLDGLRQTFERIKRDFRNNLDRNMYVTFSHNDLVSPIVVGVLNFKDDTIDAMIERCETKIHMVLTSHTSLSSNHTLFVMIRVLGTRHMEHIRTRQGRLDELPRIPMRGNDNAEETTEEKVLEKIVEIPTNEYPSFKNNCLVLAIILGAYLELGFILKEAKFKHKGFIMSKIKSKTEKARQKACQFLSREFEIVKKKVPQLEKLKENTLDNTCQLLAKHFQVNIVIHELKQGDDSIETIYSPTKREYDVELPRVDLLAKRVGDNLTGHVDVIHPHDWGFRRTRGWACLFCRKVVHTHWERHVCTGNRTIHIYICSVCHLVTIMIIKQKISLFLI